MDMSGMPGMDGSMDGSMGANMTMMMAVFQTYTMTPLYSLAWTPSGPGPYAGTCVFLIVLAVVLRGLLSLRAWQESRWLDQELKRRYVVVNGRQPLSAQVSRDSLAKHVTLTENGVEEDVVVVAKRRTHLRPWRWSTDPLRAVMDTVIAGVAYLLYVSFSSCPSCLFRHWQPLTVFAAWWPS